jgi:hypothetical protein
MFTAVNAIKASRFYRKSTHRRAVRNVIEAQKEMVSNRKADITNILKDTNAHDTPKPTKKQSQNSSFMHSCFTRWITRWQNRRKFYQTISEDEKRWIKQNDVKPEEQLLGIGIPQWMRWTLFISGATMGIVSTEVYSRRKRS